MEIPKRTSTIVLIIVAVLLVAWLMFRPDPVAVETATTIRGELLVTVDAEGKTRFKDKITVTAPITGKLSRILLREGDRIPKDYVLAWIDPNPPTPRPPSETENRTNVYASKIYAPISGRLLRILEKNDRFVTAGTPILEMGNPEAVEVVADILSTEAASVQPGASVMIEVQGQPEGIKGRVRSIEPQAFTKVSALGVEEQRVNVVIDILAKNISLGDNYRADVKIVAWHGHDVLKIPSACLFRYGERWSVFVAERGTASRREITAGHQSNAETEIIAGLNEGDIVILHPPSDLDDGSAVKTD